MNHKLRRFQLINMHDHYMICYESFKKNPADKWERSSLHTEVRDELRNILEKHGVKVYKDMEGIIESKQVASLTKILLSEGWVNQPVEI